MVAWKHDCAPGRACSSYRSHWPRAGSRWRTQHRAAMAEPDEHELAVALGGHEITQTDRQLVRDVRDGAPPVIRPGDDLRRQTELVRILLNSVVALGKPKCALRAVESVIVPAPQLARAARQSA